MAHCKLGVYFIFNYVYLLTNNIASQPNNDTICNLFTGIQYAIIGIKQVMATLTKGIAQYLLYSKGK
ncbi:MAG: hypothetical protein RM022_000455 [Nostoc sp. EfeVER01]|uniref:hypothetical protein n=1 Tax=unclassified Nostoc TaxID=2593658 RepID=UPI002AD264E4|nr:MULTISPECIES: hypothetical protein [unclassified Nostoc]MDZ7947022.1 hypothetical protein [Nostoc sp. EfeVER01]MDZ7991446.1 hypothetical protein [Nostoc sp. EspVER01]